jgi:predicted RNA-binding Zn-ribbon protein involved in translation (DUF1610 family)
MTVETRTTIEPSDINAVEFECRGCGAKTIRKLDRKLQMPARCGNCGDEWFNPNRQEVHEVGIFLEQIAEYGAGQYPYIMRFQLTSALEQSKKKAEG